MSAFDRAYDWATAYPETRPRYMARVGLELSWSARCAADRRWRGARLCDRCNGGGLVAPGDYCPECGGSGEFEPEEGSRLARLCGRAH